MKLNQTPGEFYLLSKFLRKQNASGLVLGNGDDAAVVKFGDTQVAISTDSFVEDVHFSKKYFSAKQLGNKFVHAAVSDLIAVGASPNYLFLALGLQGDLEDSWLKDLFDGIYTACEECNCLLVGGDTTSSEKLFATSTVMGTVRIKPSTRSGAKPGDNIFLTGPTGRSSAGLELLMNEVTECEDLKSYHLNCKCRYDLADLISSVNSAIDISDGLSSELNHLASSSKSDFEIDLQSLPIAKELSFYQSKLSKPLKEYVLHGGEDYELLFTSEKSFYPNAIKIGTVQLGKGEVFLLESGQKTLLEPKGFKHFKN